MLLRDVLQKTTDFLKDKGSPSARLDSELLISSALNWQRIKLYMNYEYSLSETELSSCRELVRRRASGEPIAYILGQKDFYRHSFLVSSDVLIPRPETESIVEEVLAWARAEYVLEPKPKSQMTPLGGAEPVLVAKEAGDIAVPVVEQTPPRPVVSIVDLGSGSGCIGLSIVDELEGSRLVGVDISSKAVAISEENARRLSLSDRARFVVKDAAHVTIEDLAPLIEEPVDIVVANPPYIAENDPAVEPNVKRFEPAGALFSPDEGLAHLRSWAKTASGLARSGGCVMFEIGHKQGAKASAIFAETGGFTDIKVMKDLAGSDRFVRATKL